MKKGGSSLRYEQEEFELEARLTASREAQKREEEELRAALKTSRRAAMGDEPVVEGANSSASTVAFPPTTKTPQLYTLGGSDGGGRSRATAAAAATLQHGVR